MSQRSLGIEVHTSDSLPEGNFVVRNGAKTFLVDMNTGKRVDITAPPVFRSDRPVQIKVEPLELSEDTRRFWASLVGSASWLKSGGAR